MRLVALTVDHGLRPGSEDEAGWVKEFCRTRDIDHQTLRWEGEKPQNGQAAAARDARYRLLADGARNAGTDMIFVGHTSDDQAETVLMRSSRGQSGCFNRGLAAMAPATLYDGRAWLLRPLLGVPRVTLRSHLKSGDICWIDDPSNEAERFERVRMRSVLYASDNPTELRQALIDRAGEAAERRLALGRSAASAIEKHVSKCAEGLVRIDPEFVGLSTFDEQSVAVRDYAVAVLLAVMGGSTYLPSQSRVATVLEKLNSAGDRATLSGSVADRRRSGLFLYREMRGAGPVSVDAVDEAVWDRRYRIRVEGRDAGRGSSIGALGHKQAAMLDLQAGIWPQSLFRAAQAALPALWEDRNCLGPAKITSDYDAESAEGFPLAAIPVSAPWLEFLPSFDLPIAAAVAQLIGQPKIGPIPI